MCRSRDAGKPIAVTRGKDGDCAVPLGAPCAGVSHRLAALHVAHREHGGFERHDGLESVGVRRFIGERRYPIQRESRPHPVTLRIRPTENGRGVADARREAMRPPATPASVSAAENAPPAFRSSTLRFHRREPGASSRAARARELSARAAARAPPGNLRAGSPGDSSRCRS